MVLETCMEFSFDKLRTVLYWENARDSHPAGRDRLLRMTTWGPQGQEVRRRAGIAPALNLPVATLARAWRIPGSPSTLWRAYLPEDLDSTPHCRSRPPVLADPDAATALPLPGRAREARGPGARTFQGVVRSMYASAGSELELR